MFFSDLQCHLVVFQLKKFVSKTNDKHKIARDVEKKKKNCRANYFNYTLYFTLVSFLEMSLT